MAREFYSVLGVARGESGAGLRAAFHDRARQLHQGRGEDERDDFRAVSEAYAALSSPRRRRVHDAELRLGEARDAWAHARHPGPWGQRAHDDGAVGLLDDEASVRPSFEALRDRLLRNFSGRGVPKSEHVEALHLAVVVEHDQAPRSLRLRVPSLHTCRTCEGSGISWGAACPLCAEAGIIYEEEALAVALPQDPAAFVEASLLPFGIRNLVLRVAITS